MVWYVLEMKYLIEVNDFLLTLDRVFDTIHDVSASQLEVLVT